MCGIAGYYVTNSSDPRVRLAITVLSLKQAERGTQSWGMFYGMPSSVPLIHKVAASIEDTFDLPTRLPLAMAVHTRYATTGKIKKDNAHPFIRSGTAGTVIGIHNGIIDNHFDLGLKYNRDYAVDSEHIFAQIADGLPMSELEGYGTTVYNHDSKWFIGRFNGGELTIALTELGLFYASTRRSLEHALALAQIDIKTWVYAVDGVTYELGTDGLTQSALPLDIKQPIVLTKWEDGKIKFKTSDYELFDGNVADDAEELDPTQELSDLPDDVIHFYSDGCICDVCEDSVPIGTDMFFVDDTLYCENCFHEEKAAK